jgi:hypothetical protein
VSALGLTTPYVKALAGRSRALVHSRTLPQHAVVSALREARCAMPRACGAQRPRTHSNSAPSRGRISPGNAQSLRSGLPEKMPGIRLACTTVGHTHGRRSDLFRRDRCAPLEWQRLRQHRGTAGCQRVTVSTAAIVRSSSHRCAGLCSVCTAAMPFGRFQSRKIRPRCAAVCRVCLTRVVRATLSAGKHT